jgi:hypothetical protein
LSLEDIASACKKWKWTTIDERGKTKQKLTCSFTAIWYGVHKKKPIKVVISRDPALKEPDDYFITTDIDMSENIVISEYASRWAVEDTFRNMKQYLGCEEPQSYSKDGPDKVVAMGLLLYGIVWLWALKYKPKNTVKIKPWYTKKVTVHAQ